MDRLIEIHLASSIIIYTHNKENSRLDSQTVENSKETEPRAEPQVPPPAGSKCCPQAEPQVPARKLLCQAIPSLDSARYGEEKRARSQA